MWHTGRRPIVTAIVRLAVILAALACANPVHAQGAGDYPSRQAKVLLPFSPGGVVDVMGRLLAQRLSDSLGQTFYVENHGGGGGNIGAAMVQAAAPDGYTVLITSSSFLINPGLQKVPYDPIGGFAPITIPSASPSVLVVNPAEPVSTVKELIELIRKEPGKHSYASAGVGSTPHLQGEMFKLAYGLDMVHVPFAGGGPALQSAVAGHTPIAFTALPPTAPQVQGEKLRGLAVTAAKRSSALPDVPTMAEAGVPGFQASLWVGFMAPAGTPQPIVDLLNREIGKILSRPDIKESFEKTGATPVIMTQPEFKAFMEAEVSKWAKIIEANHIPAIN